MTAPIDNPLDDHEIATALTTCDEYEPRCDDAGRLAAVLRRALVELRERRVNAVRMAEYRFAMENVPTDGNGNPLCDAVVDPAKGNNRCARLFGHKGDCQ